MKLDVTKTQPRAYSLNIFIEYVIYFSSTISVILWLGCWILTSCEVCYYIYIDALYLDLNYTWMLIYISAINQLSLHQKQKWNNINVAPLEEKTLTLVQSLWTWFGTLQVKQLIVVDLARKCWALLPSFLDSESSIWLQLFWFMSLQV